MLNLSIIINQHSWILQTKSKVTVMKFPLFLCLSVQKVHACMMSCTCLSRWPSLSFIQNFLFSFLYLSNRTRWMCNKTLQQLKFLKNYLGNIQGKWINGFKSRILHHSNNLQAVLSCTTLPSGSLILFHSMYITLYIHIIIQTVSLYP